MRVAAAARRWAVAAGIVVALLTAPATVRAAAPEAASAELPAARVTVDASALGEDADVVAAQIAEGAATILDRNGLRSVHDATAPEVVLLVSPLLGDNPGYRVDYEVRVAGERVEGSNSVSDCRLCTESELVETAQAAVEMQLERVRALQAQPDAVPPEPVVVVDPESGGGGGDDGTTAIKGPTDNKPKAGLGPLGKAGIGVGAAGVGALVAGIVLAVLPDKPQPDAMLRTTKLPGIGLAAGGGAALVTGVVLIVVDRQRAKRRAGVTGVSPRLGGGLAGISLAGRF